MGIKKVLAGLYRKSFALLPNSVAVDNLPPSSKISKNKASDSVFVINVNDVPIAKNDTYKISAGISGSRRLKFVALLGFILMVLMAAFTLFGPLTGADSPQCRSIYMYPSYARIDGFDSRFTPLAQKYHLYLYREQNKDQKPLENGRIHLNGIPVLFIPGNAGSFKQVRSVAAASANIFFGETEGVDNVNAKNLDFFTADFNEDFTAFHGRTMIDQAEYLNDAIRYILSLYEQAHGYSDPLPTSVIILGHSMGGIVARLLPTLGNYVHGSIRALITLSSPHAAAPVTFDGDILKIHRRVNDYWREQMYDRESFFAHNVSLVSITGGILDMMLPADYTAVDDILPLENGFTVYSTSIPGVWTPIDHLAVVWCDQLRKTVAKLLLEIVDSNTSEKVRPLEERMSVSRKLLLTGFEREIVQDLDVADPTQRKLEGFEGFPAAHLMKDMEQLQISQTNIDSTPRFVKFLIPSDKSQLYFSLLGSFDVTDISIYLCKGDESNKEGEQPESGVKCCPVVHDMTAVPASLDTTNFAAQSSLDSDVTPFKMLNLDWEILSNYSFIIIEKHDPVTFSDDDFLLGGLTSTEVSTNSMLSPSELAFSGKEITIPSSFQYHTLKFLKLWDSLLSYRIDASVFSKTGNSLLFEPFIRQWIESPFESKWHVNINASEIDINMHNIAPFIPVEETHDKSLKLTFVIPPDATIKIRIRVNWSLTLKMLFIRYRLVLLSFPIAIAFFVTAYQFYWYWMTGKFLAFQDVLAYILERNGFILILALLVLSPVVNNKIVQRILFMIDPVRLNRPFLLEEQHIHTNFYFLGIKCWFTSVLGVVFGVVSVSALYLFAQVFDLLEMLILRIVKTYPKADNYQNRSKNCAQASFWEAKRFTTCLILLAMVLFYIPYQLASAISLFVQIGTCIRISLSNSYLSPTEYSNLKNYNFSMLLLLSFVVAINAPIIIVFLHNVAIKWETPFRSHHNIMAIAPIVFLVSVNSTFSMPSFRSNKLYEKSLIVLLLLYAAFFSLVYGARNLYWIHHLFNIISAGLFLITITRPMTARCR